MNEPLYGIKEGQLFLAADGSKGGCVVTDALTYAECGDVIVQHFSASGMYEDPRRIAAFKLAMVRYRLVDTLPDWAQHLSPEIDSLLFQSGGPGL